MNLITWNEAYATGIPELDEDHKQVLNEVNLLWQDCIRNHRNHHDIESFISTIKKEVDELFSKEEYLLDSQPDTYRSRSIRAFQEMLEDLDYLEMDYSAGLNDYDPEVELKKILLNWIINIEQTAEISAGKKIP